MSYENAEGLGWPDSSESCFGRRAGAPNVPHYPKNKAVGMMKRGHVFTIEPMINEGSSHDMTWPDQASAVRPGVGIVARSSLSAS